MTPAHSPPHDNSCHPSSIKLSMHLTKHHDLLLGILLHSWSTYCILTVAWQTLPDPPPLTKRPPCTLRQGRIKRGHLTPVCK